MTHHIDDECGEKEEEAEEAEEEYRANDNCSRSNPSLGNTTLRYQTRPHTMSEYPYILIPSSKYQDVGVMVELTHLFRHGVQLREQLVVGLLVGLLVRMLVGMLVGLFEVRVLYYLYIRYASIHPSISGISGAGQGRVG